MWSKIPRWVKNTGRLVALGLFGLNLVETGQGAPQAAKWLRKVGIGVGHYHLIGMVIAITLAAIFGLLAIGPHRLRVWLPGGESPAAESPQPSASAPAIAEGKEARPTFSCDFITKGDHFWLVISNHGPVEVPDPPLLLNVLFPDTWELRSGTTSSGKQGNFAATSETLTALDGTQMGAWEWSFMEDAPPRPRVRQKYEFEFKTPPASGIYPVATLIHGYERFDGILAVGIPAGEVEAAVEKAKKARAESAEIARIAPLLGTELRDVRLKIERWRATEYPSPYENLPAFRWDQHAKELAANPDVYAAVERAYDAAHQANQNIRVREQKRRSGNRSAFVPESGDGLDEAHGLAGEALDALRERHNEPFQPSGATVPWPGRLLGGEFPSVDAPSVAPTARVPVAPKQTRLEAQERRKATLIRFADQGEGFRERIIRAVYPSPPTIVGGEVSWMVPRILTIKWLSELAEYARLELSEDFVKRIPTVGDPTPKAALAAIDAAIALIEEIVEAMP